jgi:hypothetical protein
VYLLSAAESRQPVKHRRHGLGLTGAAHPGTVRPVAGRAFRETHNSHGTSRDGALWPARGAACCDRGVPAARG